MILDASRNLGYLKDLTPYGATFQPLDLNSYQKEKAMLYISLRDAYERLYSYEAENHEENKPQRGYLNTYYDEFVLRYSNLNAKQNVKLMMMDAAGRDILSLERVEDGKFVKTDIFRPSRVLFYGRTDQCRLSRRSVVRFAQQIRYGQSRLYAADYRRYRGGTAPCP